jgi:hypothetical protein
MCCCLKLLICSDVAATALYCCRSVLLPQLARSAHEHNMSSVLYQPGQGYTKVVSGGQQGQQGLQARD